MMVYINECPACNKTAFQDYLTCEDHTVSHETFSLKRCESCGFVMTSPQPNIAELPRYYQSEKYISHSETSSGVIDAVYRTARRFTLKWKLTTIREQSLESPATILDYGCGTGAFLRECQDNNIQVTGVEPSPNAREIAIRITQAPIYENLSDVANTFDAITLWHVLEHVPDLHATIKKLKEVLAENGTMFIAVPNLKSADAKRYREHWAGYDVPRHLWHFSRTSMKAILEQHNLNLVNILPMKLDAYYVSLLSEKYQHGADSPQTMIKALFSGWKSNRAATKSSEYSSLIYIIRK